MPPVQQESYLGHGGPTTGKVDLVAVHPDKGQQYVGALADQRQQLGVIAGAKLVHQLCNSIHRGEQIGNTPLVQPKTSTYGDQGGGGARSQRGVRVQSADGRGARQVRFFHLRPFLLYPRPKTHTTSKSRGEIEISPQPGNQDGSPYHRA